MIGGFYDEKVLCPIFEFTDHTLYVQRLHVVDQHPRRDGERRDVCE